MSKGFDTTEDCTDHAAAIKALGYDFVVRYYFSGVSHAKTILTAAEAKALTRADVYCVVVFENASDHYGYFSYAQGLADGKAAFRYAVDVIEQPYGSPIYFAVDFDATTSQIKGAIALYFQGIAEAFTAEAVAPEPREGGTFEIGVYGSGLTCSTLMAARLATFAWLAQSSGWAGFKAFTGWNLRQGPGTTLLGLPIDPDESRGNGGGFRVAL